VQEYVNHGGYLFKVYVVGDAVTMTRRKSLPDLRGARRSNRSRRAKNARAGSKTPPPANGGDKRKGGGGGGAGERIGGVGGVGEDVSGTADVDGDVDDSGGDESHESDEDDTGGGWYATGLQSVPRVSCFKGGATDNETSWRDRVHDPNEKHTGLNEVMERMQMHSGEPSAAGAAGGAGDPAGGAIGGGPAREAGGGGGGGGGGVNGHQNGGNGTNGRDESPSDLHYLKHHKLSSHLAKNLTVSRVGSVDSIGGLSEVGTPYKLPESS
jgi:hypothetical protein